MKKHPRSPLDNRSELRIRAACEGLVYISETDAAIEFFEGRIPAGGRSSRTEVTTDITHFFDRYRRRARNEQDRDVNSKRFIDLYKVLVEELEDLKLTRIGSIRLHIYITGRDSAGKTMGIHTRAVET